MHRLRRVLVANRAAESSRLEAELVRFARAEGCLSVSAALRGVPGAPTGRDQWKVKRFRKLAAVVLENRARRATGRARRRVLQGSRRADAAKARQQAAARTLLLRGTVGPEVAARLHLRRQHRRVPRPARQPVWGCASRGPNTPRDLERGVRYFLAHWAYDQERHDLAEEVAGDLRSNRGRPLLEWLRTRRHCRATFEGSAHTQALRRAGARLGDEGRRRLFLLNFAGCNKRELVVKHAELVRTTKDAQALCDKARALWCERAPYLASVPVSGATVKLGGLRGLAAAEQAGKAALGVCAMLLEPGCYGSSVLQQLCARRLTGVSVEEVWTEFSGKYAPRGFSPAAAAVRWRAVAECLTAHWPAALRRAALRAIDAAACEHSYCEYRKFKDESTAVR